MAAIFKKAKEQVASIRTSPSEQSIINLKRRFESTTFHAVRNVLEFFCSNPQYVWYRCHSVTGSKFTWVDLTPILYLWHVLHDVFYKQPSRWFPYSELTHHWVFTVLKEDFSSSKQRRVEPPYDGSYTFGDFIWRKTKPDIDEVHKFP